MLHNSCLYSKYSKFTIVANDLSKFAHELYSQKFYNHAART